MGELESDTLAPRWPTRLLKMDARPREKSPQEPPDEASEYAAVRRSNRTPVPKLMFSLDELGGDLTLC